MKTAFLRCFVLLCIHSFSNAWAGSTACEISSKKNAPTLIGSEVILTTGKKNLSVAVFLGKQQIGNDEPIYYFLDTDSHRIFWSSAEDIQWAYWSPQPTILEVAQHAGNNCYAYSIVNCIDNFHSVLLSAEQRKDLLKAAIKATSPGNVSNATTQDRNALRVLKQFGISAHFTHSKNEVLRHLENGRPAILGVNVRFMESMNLFKSGSASPRGLTRHYQPAPDRDYPHAIVAIGRIQLEEGEFSKKGDWIIVLESRSGEIMAWKTEDVMESLLEKNILVNP